MAPTWGCWGRRWRGPQGRLRAWRSPHAWKPSVGRSSAVSEQPSRSPPCEAGSPLGGPGRSWGRGPEPAPPHLETLSDPLRARLHLSVPAARAAAEIQ